MIVLLAAGIALLCVSAPASAVSLNGIVVYSTDDFGTPSGVDTLDRPEDPEMHLWRTYSAGKWHALAVYQGLPPQSLSGRPRPLNSSDFSVFIPLEEGENFFTIVGEPGPITATDQFQRYAVNLYFDGGMLNPGISMLFPRYAPETGGATGPNRSQFIYSFDVSLVQQRSPGIDDSGYEYYDDGFFRVTVTEASLLPEDHFMSIDLLSGRSFKPSGVSDFVGSLVILVEPSAGASGTGNVPRGAVGGGGIPNRSGIPGGGGGPAPFFGPTGPGYVGAPPNPMQDPGYQARDQPAAVQDDDVWVSGDATEDDLEPEPEPTERDGLEALRGWLKKAVDDEPSEDGEDEADADAAADAAAEGTAASGTETPTGITPTPDLTPTVDAAVEPTPTPGTPTPTTKIETTVTPESTATSTGKATPSLTPTKPSGSVTPATTDPAVKKP